VRGKAVSGRFDGVPNGLVVHATSTHDQVAVGKVHLDGDHTRKFAHLSADGRDAVLAGHTDDPVGVLAVAHRAWAGGAGEAGGAGGS
jgi:hypothetical protein